MQPHSLGIAAGLPGMPQERLMRIAARQAFVEMKAEFLQALDGLEAFADAGLDDEPLAQLRSAVRLAHEPGELWSLQHRVLRALDRDPVDGPRVSESLRQSLDTLFPPSGVAEASELATLR